MLNFGCRKFLCGFFCAVGNSNYICFDYYLDQHSRIYFEMVDF